MEAVQSILQEYESVIDRLFKSDKWFRENKFKSWEEVDAKIRGKRIELEKEAYQLQKDLHKHMNIKCYG